MASNPMQRKARNSFLLGVILTLVVAVAIGGLLFVQIKKLSDEIAARDALLTNVYVLKNDIKSGQEVTSDMFEKRVVDRNTVPSDATSSMDFIDTWTMQTKDGTDIVTLSDGELYLPKSDSIIEILTENGEYYKVVDGEKVKTTIKGTPINDDEGMFVIDANSEDNYTRIYEDANGNYYTYRVDNTSLNSNITRTKEYLELNNVPLVAKIDLKENTVVTEKYFIQADSRVSDDVRREEYNVIVLPMDLMTGDYVDIRLMLPSGQNFTVVSKVEVEIPTYANGKYVSDTIWVNMREDETLVLSSAIVEAAGIKGAKLYASKYVEAGTQNAAVVTYIPNAAVVAQLAVDGNILKSALDELYNRYTSEAVKVRNEHLQSIINESTTYKNKVESEIESSINDSITIRKEYLNKLTD